MAVYQDKAKERIKKGLRKMNGVVDRAIRDDYKEADTRKIVSDLLCEYLGWDKYANLTAEQMIGSRFADYVVKKDGEQLFVVEVHMSRTWSRGNEGPSQEFLPDLGLIYHHPISSSDRLCL